MNITLRTRRWVLLAAMPLVAAAALHTNGGDEAPPRDRDARARPQSAANTVNAAGRSPERVDLPKVDMDRLQSLSRRHVSVQPPVDLFAAPRPMATDSEQAAAKAAPPPPAPPPQAPALPFRFIGRQDGDGAPLIFLEQQQQTHIVRIGETVADGWRLDRAEDQALVFTYVPLGQQRLLATGSAG